MSVDIMRKNDAGIYTEDENAGNVFREKQLSELNRFIEKCRAEAPEKRARFFQPDESSPEKYALSAERYRELYRRMLGWP
jgi:sugar (pentulose or hexulose) kinase